MLLFWKRAIPWYLWALFATAFYLRYTIYLSSDLPTDFLSFLVFATHDIHLNEFLVLPLLSLALVRFSLQAQDSPVRLRVGERARAWREARDGFILAVSMVLLETFLAGAAFAMNAWRGIETHGINITAPQAAVAFVVQVAYLGLWAVGYQRWLREMHPLLRYFSIFFWSILLTASLGTDSDIAKVCFYPLMSWDESLHIYLPWQGAALVVAAVWAAIPYAYGRLRRQSGRVISGTEIGVIALTLLAAGMFLYSTYSSVQRALADSNFPVEQLEYYLQIQVRGFYPPPDIFGSGLVFTLLLMTSTLLFSNRLARRIEQGASVLLRGGLTPASVTRLLLGNFGVLAVAVAAFFAAFAASLWGAGGEISAAFAWKLAGAGAGLALTGLLTSILESFGQTRGIHFVGIWAVLLGCFGLSFLPISGWLPWVGTSAQAPAGQQLTSLTLTGLLAAGGLILNAYMLRKEGISRGYND